MRRPTIKELLELAFLWLVILFACWRSINAHSFDLSDLVWLALGVIWTYRYFNAEAYTKHKAGQAETEADLKLRFGRWYKLVQWSPILFFYGMLLLAILMHSLTLVLVGFAGLLLGSILLAFFLSKSSPE